MNNQEFFFTQQAAERLRELIAQMQQVSLIAAERVRSRIFHKIHLIHHHPLQSSRKVDFNGLDGHFRVCDVLNYKLYYLVTEDKITVVDILMEKEVAQS